MISIDTIQKPNLIQICGGQYLFFCDMIWYVFLSRATGAAGQ